MNIDDILIQYVTICHVWVACWLGAVFWAGWVGGLLAGWVACLLAGLGWLVHLFGPSLHAYLRCILSLGCCFACVFTVVSFPWEIFCMRIYRDILSLRTILHAYLP